MSRNKWAFGFNVDVKTVFFSVLSLQTNILTFDHAHEQPYVRTRVHTSTYIYLVHRYFFTACSTVVHKGSITIATGSGRRQASSCASNTRRNGSQGTPAAGSLHAVPPWHRPRTRTKDRPRSTTNGAGLCRISRTPEY